MFAVHFTAEEQNRVLCPPDLPGAALVVVVSGIPRAGTSMLMQMLGAGGFPLLTDDVRRPDEDNPRGYFEYERVKDLRSDAGWITGATGRAIKIVAPLLPFLPSGPEYRVIFAERSLDEAIASQARMLVRRGQTLPDTAERRERLKTAFRASIIKARNFVNALQGARLLSVERDWVLRDAAAAAAAINAFLGGGLDESKMAGVVDPLLNRFGRAR